MSTSANKQLHLREGPRTTSKDHMQSICKYGSVGGHQIESTLFITMPRNLKPVRVGWVQRDDRHLGKNSCVAKFLHLYPRHCNDFENIFVGRSWEHHLLRHSCGILLSKTLSVDAFRNSMQKLRWDTLAAKHCCSHVEYCYRLLQYYFKIFQHFTDVQIFFRHTLLWNKNNLSDFAR